MRQIIYDQRERLGQWALEQIGYPDTWGERYQAIGLLDREEIVAAAIYTDFAPDITITMHVAGTRFWASPAFGKACFRYAFIQCGVRRITAYAAEKNVKCQRFIEHLGFRHEGLMRDALPGDHALVYGMLKEEAHRWLA